MIRVPLEPLTLTRVPLGTLILTRVPLGLVTLLELTLVKLLKELTFEKKTLIGDIDDQKQDLTCEQHSEQNKQKDTLDV